MPPTLQDALLHHQAGDLPRAAQLYREILAADQRHADAYHLLGVLMHQLQHCRAAVDLIGQAIQINHGFAPYHNNLGNALLALGQRDEARASFRRSLQLNPNADTYINLATLDLGDGRIQEAKASLHAALRLSPERVESLVGLGRIAVMEGQPVLARRWLERALAIQPDCVPALNCLGDLCLGDGRLHEAETFYARATECLPSDVEAHLKLGHLSMRLERYGLAAASYGRAFQLSPRNHSTAVLLGMAHLLHEDREAANEVSLRALQLDDQHPASHHLRGSALVLARDYEASLASFDRALRLAPELHEAMNGLGNAYEGLGDYTRASQAFGAALALEPQNPTYLLNVGINLARQGDRRAISLLDQAVALAPNDAKTHIALGESLLLFGDYKRGFAEYEWRWRSPSFTKQHRHYDAPLWDGSPLSGKTILLHAEQGLGDTIQFVRFLPQVACLEGNIVLIVQQPLLRLFESLEWVGLCLHQDADPLPAFDVHCPLLSLPAVLGTGLQTIPGPIDLACALSPALGPVVSMQPPQHLEALVRVGIAWAGNPNHLRDSLRSLPLASLLPLREVKQCTFFNLQKMVPPADQATLESFAMEHPLDACHDFLDTAHAIMQLDLILSVDTAVAHLAATLCKPVWLILPEAADWRWGTTGDTTPWYPTMKLFRRHRGETTTHLIGRLVRALNQNTAAIRSARGSNWTLEVTPDCD
jgi:tetratricopeptide (TPR) repeat protein